MIPLEGKMLSGLDEFMLRLGHLKVLCDVASDVGGSWFRINRETSRRLTVLFPVPEVMRPTVAEYLCRKRLCRIVDPEKEERGQKAHYRYPNLLVERDKESGNLTLIDESSEGHELSLWWQDLCLAGDGIRSRVGGITISGKSGSKTGLSHLADWAQISEFISPAGDVAAMGRLFRLAKKNTELVGANNPYVLGSERLPIAYCLLGADIDLFSRLAPKLQAAAVPIRKAEAAELFAEAMSDVVQEARTARYLSAGRKAKLYENYRDLEGPAKRSRRPLGGTSTAWHRASSRLESYVDLGLLEKGRKGEDERYEYIYYPTINLDTAVRTLDQAPNGRTWIEQHLSDVVFGVNNSNLELSGEEFASLLPTVASHLARPAAPLPIDALAVGAVCVQAERGAALSIGACRLRIEAMAREFPELARLSRGAYGDRAEYVSLDLRALEQQYANDHTEAK
jgi:hypothetical protein